MTPNNVRLCTSSLATQMDVLKKVMEIKYLKIVHTERAENIFYTEKYGAKPKFLLDQQIITLNI